MKKQNVVILYLLLLCFAVAIAQEDPFTKRMTAFKKAINSSQSERQTSTPTRANAEQTAKGILFDAAIIKSVDPFIIANSTDHPLFGKGMTRHLYFRHPTNAGMELHIKLIVGSYNNQDVYDLLLSEIVGCTLPMDQLTDKFKPLSDVAGDHAFGNIETGQGLVGAFGFIRSNIGVFITSSSLTFNLFPLATEIDELIISNEKPEPDAPVVPLIDISPAIPDSIVKNSTDPLTFQINNFDASKTSVKVMNSKGKVTANIENNRFVITPLSTGVDQIGVLVYNPQTLSNRWSMHDIKIVMNK